MANQVNYNDGKWHGWNGGECPVHPKSEVEVRFRGYAKEYYLCDRREAGVWAWRHYDSSYDIIAFRVINEHKGPREFLVNEYPHGPFGDISKAKKRPTTSPELAAFGASAFAK